MSRSRLLAQGSNKSLISERAIWFCRFLVVSSDVSKNCMRFSPIVLHVAIVLHTGDFFFLSHFIQKSALCWFVSLKILYAHMKLWYDFGFYATASVHWVCPYIAGANEF